MDQELKITQFRADQDPDIDELVLLINRDEPHPARNILVDDKHGIYLRRDLETDQVVGAVIFHARDWFAEIARAFANQDLNNADVRFFLEKKLEHAASENPGPQDSELFTV